MILAKVIGSIVSTIKHHTYHNKKLMLVKPINPDGELKANTLMAVDIVDAGVGDTVLIASEGRAASELLGYSRRIPLRDVIVGIVDRIDLVIKKEEKL
jgi:microcompartment protein CcmK/EutM